MNIQPVLHIGYPKSASTSLQKFLAEHDGIRLVPVTLFPFSEGGSAPPSVQLGQIDERRTILTNEKIAESLINTGDSIQWHANKFVPGAWDKVSKHVRVDPTEAAIRARERYGCTQVLVIIRDQVSWLQSAYKYYMPRLPQGRRSFADFCSTPRGHVFLSAGHYDRTISAYLDVFGPKNVKVVSFEKLAGAPDEFAREVCDFLHVAAKPMIRTRENVSSSNRVSYLRARFPSLDNLPSGVKKLGARMLSGFGSESQMILTLSEIDWIRNRYAESNQQLQNLLCS